VTGGSTGTLGDATVQPRVAGLASTFPARSVARTAKRWSPVARPVYVVGDEHADQAAPSRRHSKVGWGPFAAKAKLAVPELTVPAGPDVIEVLGAVERATMARRVRTRARARQVFGRRTRSRPRRAARRTRVALRRRARWWRATRRAERIVAPRTAFSWKTATPWRASLALIV
jgi:hypothetical protein